MIFYDFFGPLRTTLAKQFESISFLNYSKNTKLRQLNANLAAVSYKFFFLGLCSATFVIARAFILAK